MNYGTQNWEPESFFDDSGNPFTPDHIASGFDLDPAEYSSYFPKYDDWKTEFAEKEYGVDVEEYQASKTLLNKLKESQTGRLEEKKEEAGTSLAQGLGATYSQAATQYADVAKQSINQQVSFTSGVSGRQKEEAFERTQESLMQNTMEQNLAFTSTSRDLEQATTDLDAQYEFDTGKIGRDLEKSEIDKDYKTRAGKEQWEDSIYDTLRSLTQTGAWEEEETPKHWGEHEGWDFLSFDEEGNRGSFFSDITLKEDIDLIGISASGINIYEFGYIDTPGRYQGVMAQELIHTEYGNAVSMDHGYYMVNYNKIDVEFRKIK